MSISKEQKKKALVIGVSHYNNLQSLDLCKNDAEELFRVLSEQEYEIPHNHRLMGDVPSEIMKKTIYGFFNDTNNRREDTLIFYFSGHGLPDGHGKHFLAPSDIDPNNAFEKGLDFDTLEYLINRICHSDRVIAILDCCFSGAAGLEGAKGEDDISVAKQAREAMELRMKASRGRCILASSLSDQQSVIKKDLGHSLFTYHLLEGLKGKEGYVNDLGYVTADYLSNYVFDKMLQEPKRPQTPIRKLEVSGELIVTYHPKLAKRELGRANESIPPSPSSSAEIYLKWMEADRYEKNEDYESALSCYEEAIAIDPNNYASYNRKGDALFKLGQNDEAIKAYSRAITVKPGHPDAYDLKGDVYFKLGDYEQALEYYDKALKIKPRSFEFLKDKGLALFNLKEYKQALEYFDEALKIKPNQSTVLEPKKEALNKIQEIDELANGISLYNSGKHDEALGCFKRSLEANSENAQTLYYKGLVLAHLSQFDEAITCYEEALKIVPTYNAAQKAKESAIEEQKREKISSLIADGRKYSKNSDYQNAVDSFDRAIDLNPQNYIPYYEKGNVQFKLEEYDEALECYTKALQIKPDYYYAWYNKGTVLYKKGDDFTPSESNKSIEYFNEAKSCYDEALKIDKNKAESWYNKGCTLKKLSKISKLESRDEEIECFDKALGIKPDYPEAYYGKGQALADLEKYDKAIECFEEALKTKSPYHEALKAKESAEFKIAEAHYIQGQALSDSMKYEEAIESFNKALKIKPTYDKALKAKEAAHEKQKEKEISLILDDGLKNLNNGNYDNAIASFDRVIDANPNNTLAHNYKGNVYSKRGDHKQALDFYNKALEIDPKNFYALQGKGLALFKLEEYRQAISYFDEALKIRPNQSTVLQYRKQALLKLEEITTVPKVDKGVRLVAQGTREEGTKRAFIISIGSYTDKRLHPLDFCQKNGEAMSELLGALGYEIIDNRKLVGAVKFDTMMDAICDFFDNSQTAANDTLLFYFSGYGVPDGYGNVYIATSEIDPGIPTRRGISFGDLINWMNLSISKKVVVLLDCCFSGADYLTSKGYENDAEAAKSASASTHIKAKPLQEREGRCILASSMTTQEAYGTKEKDHSIFTYHLLEGLKGASGESMDIDRCVTPSSLGEYVYDKVTAVVKQKPLIKTETTGKIILANYQELTTSNSQSEPGKVYSDISSIIDEGDQCVENYDYENAIELYNRAIILNPKDHRPFIKKGEAFFKLSRYEEAITAYDGAIDANPRHRLAYNLKGDALSALSKFDEAIQSYDKALKIDPNYFDVLKDKGLVFDKLGRFDKAIECYDRALKVIPDNAMVLENRQKAISKLGEIDKTVNERSYESKYATQLSKENYKFETAWSINDTPKAVAVDLLGDVYVTASNSTAITRGRLRKKTEALYYSYFYIFNQYGSITRKLGGLSGTGDGQFSHPDGIAIDTSGSVYVVDTDNDRIQKFDNQGKFITKWGTYGSGDGQFKHPDGIAIDTSGSVYVVDTDNDRIQKFDNQGKFITKWGNEGFVDGKFDTPIGIAIDMSDNVYVTDSGNHRIEKFDNQGKFITKWGTYGSGDGQFEYPDDVAIDSFGNVYVADRGNNRIQKFDNNSTFITKWGTKGSGDGQFSHSDGIAIDTSGSVYVVDADNNRMQKFQKAS